MKGGWKIPSLNQNSTPFYLSWEHLCYVSQTGHLNGHHSNPGHFSSKVFHFDHWCLLPTKCLQHYAHFWPVLVNSLERKAKTSLSIRHNGLSLHPILEHSVPFRSSNGGGRRKLRDHVKTTASQPMCYICGAEFLLLLLFYCEAQQKAMWETHTSAVCIWLWNCIFNMAPFQRSFLLSGSQNPIV